MWLIGPTFYDVFDVNNKYLLILVYSNIFIIQSNYFKLEPFLVQHIFYQIKQLFRFIPVFMKVVKHLIGARIPVMMKP